MKAPVKISCFNFLLKARIVLAFALLSGALRSAEVVQMNYLNKSAIVSLATINVVDPLAADETAHPTWYEAKRKHVVRLAYHRESRTDVGTASAWTYTVNYDFYRTGFAGSTTESGSVTVTYTPGSSNDIYEALKEHVGSALTGYADVTLKVTSVSSTGTPPADIRLELLTVTTRYTDLALANTSTTPLIAYSPTTAELTWGFIPGAEEYDVEWTFIDDEDAPPSFTSLDEPFTYKEPVRITTSNQYYLIDRQYSKGIIYFRVRPVGRHIGTLAAGNYTHLSYGDWGYTNGSAVQTYNISASFESNKNWNYTAVYAESGKSKKGIGFTDGGGKLRQSQATMNSTNSVMVGDNKYDIEGRPVISVMPVPVDITDPLTAFSYRGLFNKDASAGEYMHTDFDLGTLPMGNTSGAGKYYSDQNPFQTSDPFAKYTADAGGASTGSTTDGGYPFTQVRYTRDNTGRVSVTTGGAGADHVIDGGHQLKYFYCTPNSTELYRMFGTNVGIASHYKKNLALDANGQMSISYLDQENRVVATALAGAAPANLVALDNNGCETIPVSMNDNNRVFEDDHYSSSTNSIGNVVPNTVHTFTYDMAGVIYGFNVGIDGTGFYDATNDPPSYDSCKLYQSVPLCADCKYKLSITITDPDGLVVQMPDGGSNVNEITRVFSNPDNPNCENNQYDQDGLTFAVTFTKVGDYTVNKVLTLDTTGIYLEIQDAIAAAGLDEDYRDDLVDCYVSHTDFGQCDLTCEQHCTTEILLAHPEWAADQVTYAEEISDAVNSCIESECGEIIDNVVTDVAESQCQEMYVSMLNEVSPGGAEYLETYTQPTTLFWARVNAMLNTSGCTPTSSTCIYIVDASNNPVPLTTLQNPALWQPEWADQLIKAHRDYCHYQNCTLLTGTNAYDMQMGLINGWTAANAAGYLDPAGMGRTSTVHALPVTGITTVTGAIDPMFATQSITSGDRYRMLADELDGTTSTFVNWSPYTNIWDFASNSASPVYNTPGFGLTYNDANKYAVFRGLYNDLKWRVFNDWYERNIGKDCPYYEGSPTAPPPGAPDLTDTELIDNAYDIVNDCAEKCELNAIYWMSQLEHFADSTGCTDWTSLTALQLNEIKFNLMEFCQNNCGKINPMGYILADDLNADPFTHVPAPADPYLDHVQDILNGMNNSTSCPDASIALNYLSAGDPYDISCNGSSQVTPVYSTNVNLCFNDFIDYLDSQLPITTTACFDMHGGGDSLQIDCLGGRYLSVLSGLTSAAISTGGPSSSSSSCSSTNCQTFRFYKADGTLLNISDFISITLPKFTNSSPVTGTPLGTFKQMRCVVNTSSGPFYAYVYEARSGGGCTAVSLVRELPVTNFCMVSGYNITGTGSVTLNFEDYQDDCIQQLLSHDTIQANEDFNLLVQSFKQQYITAHFKNCFSDDLDEDFSDSYSTCEYQYTLYYYDQAGNLTQTVPPKGFNPVALTHFSSTGVYDGTMPAHTYRTRYTYNSLNQVVSQETPDGGLTNYYYDPVGRLRFSQNAKQTPSSKYSYTIYDEQSRITEVGESSQLYTGSTAFYNGVSDMSFPNSSRAQVTVTTYDKPATVAPVTSGYFTSGQQFLRTRVATTQFYEGAYSGTSTGLSAATHYSYDEHGNVNELVQENTLLASLGIDNKYKYMRYNYELVSGNVKDVAYQPGKADQFYHRYIYDADNRLTIAQTCSFSPVTLSFDLGYEKDAKYFYYKHGPLARTETGEDKVQGMDYAYTINGWLKGINATTINTSRDMGKDANLNGTAISTTNNNAFVAVDGLNYTLGYFDGDYTSVGGSTAQAWLATTVGTPFCDAINPYRNLYNGNISHTTSAFFDNTEAAVATLGRTYRYDQLNRLKQSDIYLNVSGATDLVNSNNSFTGAVTNNNYKETFSYDPNGNITYADRWSKGGGGTLKMDQLTYNYIINTNQLEYVDDAIGVLGDDMGDQAALNYSYDLIGNLKSDALAEIDKIDWNVYGKISSIERTTTSTKTDLDFKYDASGNRICKIAKPRASSAQQTEQYWTYTYYVRDAQGNVMAVYDRDVNAASGTITDEIKVKEHDIYGSSRVGIETKTVTLGGGSYAYSSLTYNSDGTVVRPGSMTTINAATISNPKRTVGDKNYELSNHLGNVMAVVTDKKIGLSTSGLSTDAEYYKADVLSSQDYYSFGAQMPFRNYNTTATQFGYQGSREDFEIYGEGNAYTTDFREMDPRLGRWFSIDPRTGLTSGWSPYNSNFNNPIRFKDSKGDFPPIVWLLLAGTLTDAAFQVSVTHAIDPDATWESAVANIDWGDALITGGVTALSAGTATEVVVGGSVYRAAVRKLTQLSVKGEILKATIDWSPANEKAESRFKITIAYGDNNKGLDETAIDLTCNWIGNEMTQTILSKMKTSIESDLTDIAHFNNMKFSDRAQYKFVSDVINSPETEVSFDITNNYFGEGSSSGLKMEYTGDNNEDSSDKIKQQYDEIVKMNKEITKIFSNKMYKVQPDATKVVQKSVPRLIGY